MKLTLLLVLGRIGVIAMAVRAFMVPSLRWITSSDFSFLETSRDQSSASFLVSKFFEARSAPPFFELQSSCGTTWRVFLVLMALMIVMLRWNQRCRCLS